MEYDIDFPVSEDWAEFYREKGFRVDPGMIVCTSPPRRASKEQLTALNEQVLRTTQDLVVLIKELLRELSEAKRLPNTRNIKKKGGIPLWRFKNSLTGTSREDGILL